MSSILKGIVDEEGTQKFYVVYIDGTPATKYINSVDAKRAVDWMSEKYPNKKFTINHQAVGDERVDTLYINDTPAVKYSQKDTDKSAAAKRLLSRGFTKNKYDIKPEVREDEDNSTALVRETDLDENLHKWFNEKWVRFGPDGKIRGTCARGDDSEGKPKCLPQAKAHSLGKKGRKYAANKKRREDPNPERSGKAINVATKKKTDEDIQEAQKCPHCGGELVSEDMMNEKQDACYRKVKSRYKVWPSAYASGALVQCRKKGASNWGNSKKNESNSMKGLVDEAGSPAQQAAIAINMKKHHKKPKNVDEDYTGIESGPSSGPFTAEVTPAINPYGGLKDKRYRGAIGEGISEGEVVPFRRKELTWKDIPGDVKSLLNDLFWAEMETGSYAGTTNKKYRKQLDDEIDEVISAMQNRGWRFQRDRDKDVVELTNTKGQTVTLPDTIEFLHMDEFEDKLTEMPDTSGPVGVQPGGWRKYKPKSAGVEAYDHALKNEDTSYAGGGGQGGNAGQSYRKFTPKSAGTNMKKESSILKGLRR